MKHIINVPSPLIRAARLFQADNDPRFCLRGIHLSKAGYIESTNGHSAFRAPCEACKELDESIIIRVQGSGVGKKNEEARIHLDDSGLGWITFGESGKPDRTDSHGITARVNIHKVTAIKFVDLERIFETMRKKPAPVESIGISAEYIELAGKAAKALGATLPQLIFTFSGAQDVIFARSAWSEIKYPHEIAIMPVQF